MMNYPRNIRQSGLTIYDKIQPSEKELYIPTQDLEVILSDSLCGLSLAGYPLRTRSKVVKTAICKALGYPVPKSFKKTQPKFPCQNFDVYTQKSLNVQIWNESVDANRRYVFLSVDENDVIRCVRIITGSELAKYDHTGTLTQKYQARMNSFHRNICSKSDSPTVENWTETNEFTILSLTDPNEIPSRDKLLKISEINRRLLPLVGESVSYLDAVQERTRGDELHSMICQALGYSNFEDDGSYPDIANQLLEIKLQTSPTIDLGLHSPDDDEEIMTVGDTTFYSYDIRYVIFDGSFNGDRIILNNLYLVSGVDFFNYFPRFQGKGTNKKLQIPLPSNFFNR